MAQPVERTRRLGAGTSSRHRLAIACTVTIAALALPALSASPAFAGTCSGVGANMLPAGTTGADGSVLSGPITDWFQVYGQCTPAYSTVSATVPGGRSIVEWWAHAPSDCARSPSNTLTCPGKDDGRICMYLKTSGPPSGGMQTDVHVAFPDASTFDTSPLLGGEASPCPLTSR